MSPDVLTWLQWLVQQQTVAIGAPDAREVSQMAFRALDEISDEIAEQMELSG